MTKLIASNRPGQLAVELIQAHRLGIDLTPALLTAVMRSNRLRNGKVTVPRREILSAAEVLLRRQALHISRGLKNGDLVEQELARVQTGGGQSSHDDLAIATALAIWQALQAVPALRSANCR